VPDLSRAILNITEGCEGFQIQKKWFRDTAPSHDYDNPDTDSVRLGLESFKGLFIVNGLALCAMLVINFMHTNCTELRNRNLHLVHSSREIATDNDDPQQGQQLQNNNAALSEPLQVERGTN
jgi:ionotropic glutamate receptor